MDLRDYSVYIDHVREQYKVVNDVIVAEFVESFQRRFFSALYIA